MAYKISGSAAEANRAHVIKDGVYIGYKDVTPGSYDLVFDADDNANVMTTAEKTDGETVGYGGMTAIPTVDSSNLTLPASANLLKTGQTTSYATGDDGELEKGIALNIQRTTIGGGAVVKDFNTGLMWVADPESAGCNNGNGFTWTNAQPFAGNLTFAGFSDWRTPNVKEMLSTVTFELYTASWGGYYTPTEFWYLGGGNYFPDRKDFWTSTTHGENTGQAWVINVAGTDGGLIQLQLKTYPYPLVRPVRTM